MAERPEAALAPDPASVANARTSPRAGRVALIVYLVCTAIYALFAWDRLPHASLDNHFSYQADAYLHGSIAVRCSPADVSSGRCPNVARGNDWATYEGRYYVVFPSFPALLYALPVALFGRDFPNVILDVLIAGLAPSLLFLLLERLAREGRSERSWKQNLAFTALFAFGTVYFYSAVQGDVWYVAHVTAAALLVGYLWFALDARAPFMAGVCMALAFHTRASVIYAAPFFALEALRVHRADVDRITSTPVPETNRVRQWVRGTDWPRVAIACASFALPVAIAVGVALALNKARFGDPREVGYRFLNVIQRDRMERWGLFNYHYLARNLGVVLASLPWLSRTPPFVLVPYHGLALWLTTPHFLELARLRRRPGTPYATFLAVSASVVAASVLLYQNTGWQQFGYRFSNDFAIFLVLLLAIHGAAIGRAWKAALLVAIVLNAFGAATFLREVRIEGQPRSFYTGGNTQPYYQPD